MVMDLNDFRQKYSMDISNRIIQCIIETKLHGKNENSVIFSKDPIRSIRYAVKISLDKTIFKKRHMGCFFISDAKDAESLELIYFNFHRHAELGINNVNKWASEKRYNSNELTLLKIAGSFKPQEILFDYNLVKHENNKISICWGHKPDSLGMHDPAEYNSCMTFNINNETMCFKNEKKQVSLRYDIWKKHTGLGYYLNLDEDIWKKTYQPMIKVLINFISDKINTSKENKSNKFILVPINNNLKQEDRKAYLMYVRNKEYAWYKKLLEEYNKNANSTSKSVIIEKHYQNQAELHGLKFIRK